MKEIKKNIIIVFTCILVFTLTGCGLIERTTDSVEKTIYAKVGKTKITKGEVDLALKQYLSYYKSYYGEDYESNPTVAEALKNLRTQQLEGLVDKEVLYQSAESLGVKPTEDELKKEVDDRISYYKEVLGSDEKYLSWLEENEYTEESFQKHLEKMVVVSMVVDKMLEDVNVSDEEIETYYNDNIDTYTKDPGANVTHIVFKFEKDAAGNLVKGTEEAALEKANKARKQVLSGISLEDIADSDEYSSSSKYENLGRVSFEGRDIQGNSMEQSFTDGFKDLPINEVSEPVRTSYGYHLIVNTMIYPNREVSPLDAELKVEIKNKILSSKQEELYAEKLTELKKNIKIKTYEDKI